MDVLAWPLIVLVMAVGSYRAVLLWQGRTTAFDAWPLERRRALPAPVWLGTAFFVAGAVLVVGDFGDTHPVSILAALVATVGGVGCAVTYAGLYFWGRPQRLVPPHLRDGAPRRRGRP